MVFIILLVCYDNYEFDNNNKSIRIFFCKNSGKEVIRCRPII